MDSPFSQDVRNFISSEYLFGDDSRMPADTDSLLETGVLDSTGVQELIEFLESTYSITVEDDETIPENLGSIDNLCRYLAAKTSDAGAA